MYTKEKAMYDYQGELEMAYTWQDKGQTTVTAEVAGSDLAQGREMVEIDEYIAFWKEKLAAVDALREGADAEAFNY